MGAKASKYEESESGMSVHSYTSLRSARSGVSRVSRASSRSNISRACSCKSSHSVHRKPSRFIRASVLRKRDLQQQELAVFIETYGLISIADQLYDNEMTV